MATTPSPLTILDSDPAKIGWPPTLPIEIALREQTPKEICAAYGIDRAEWQRLCADPVFGAAVQKAADMLQKEGMSFRVKAQLQSEELLRTSWGLIHSPNDQVAPSVKADLIKFTVLAAGLDASIEQKANGALGAGAGPGLQINIHLTAPDRGVTIEGT